MPDEEAGANGADSSELQVYAPSSLASGAMQRNEHFQAENRPSIVCSSSHTLRAPVHQEFKSETGTHVLVLDGHNHQVVIEASRTGPSRRPRSRSVVVQDGSPCEQEGNPVYEGNKAAHGHSQVEGSDGGDEDQPPQLHIYARHADKFAIGPVVLLRLALTYSAAVLVIYFFIFGLNMLMKYSMTVLVPVLLDQHVWAGVFTMSCIPALCEFLASLITLSMGLAADIWNDLHWLDNTANDYMPHIVRHWTILFLLLIAPVATFIFATWISPDDGTALTACLLCVIVSLLTLFAVYFITIVLARVRLCMLVVDEGHGFWRNFLQVFNVSLVRRFSFPLRCLARFFPSPHVTELEATDSRVEEGCNDAADQGSFAVKWSRAKPHECLEYNPATKACEKNMKVVNTACWGACVVQEEWTADALKGDSRGVLTEFHTQRMLTSCCLNMSSSRQTTHPDRDRNDSCQAVSAASALVLVVLLFVIAAISSSVSPNDGDYDAFAVAAVIIVLIAAFYLAVPISRSMWIRWRAAKASKQSNTALANEDTMIVSAEMQNSESVLFFNSPSRNRGTSLASAAAPSETYLEMASVDAATAPSSPDPLAAVGPTCEHSESVDATHQNPLTRLKNLVVSDPHVLPKRPVLVPVRWLMITLFISKIVFVVILPIVSFSVLASQTGLWYMNAIVVISSLYSGFTHVFDLEATLRWAGPAAMLKLQNQGWQHGRAAHLLIHRMQPRVATRIGFFFFAIMAAFITFLSIAGTNQDPSTYQGLEYAYNASLPANISSGQRYPLCNLPEPIPGFSVLDYGMLADVAYVANQSQVNTLVDSYFGPGELNVFKNYSNKFHGSYYIFNVDGTKDFIISIRGTSSLLDMITDANLWLEVVFVQLGRWILPAGSLWDVAYPYIISSLNVDQGNEEFQYDTIIEQEVEMLLQVPDSRVVLTGHSLGGGVGGIVSARKRVPAIFFSGPNSVLSRRKFDITRDQLDAWPINIIPNSDPVAHIDLPSNLAQRVNCLGTGLDCHHLDRTQCEIQSACGTGGRPIISPEICGKYGYSYKIPKR